MYISCLNDLKKLPQWVCYTLPEKKPINPHTGAGADCNDPDTWGTYDQARFAWRRNGYPGLGFEFLKEQGLTGVDLDKCVDEDGNISEFAQGIIKRLNSYAEFSPSGKGIHIWVRGNIPANLKANGDGIEMYDHIRYFTVTGNRVPGTPEGIGDRQEELTKIYGEITEQRNNEQKKNRPQSKVISFPGLDTPYGLAALDTECQDVASAPNGSRNESLNRAAYSLGQLIAGNELSRGTVERELYAAAERAGLGHREIERTMRSGIESGMKSPRTRPVDDIIYGTDENTTKKSPKSGDNEPPDINFILKCLSEAEYGDSLLFAHLFKGKVVYDHTSQEWYLWAGHWWICDETGKIKHLVSGRLASVYLQGCAKLYEQANQKVAKAEIIGDEKEVESAKEALEKHKKTIKDLTGRAYALRQAARLKNVLYFSSAHDGMGIVGSQWDSNPWLLGVPNGVLDLKTGELRDGQPADYIRTTSPTEWKGINAPASRWERFLEEIFEDRAPEERKELISFLQRLLGYGITGVVMEHIFAVFYGEDGRNGKDTIQKALTDTLGSVSGAIHKDVLLDTGRGHSAGAPTPHLSDLQGRRLAWASEPEKGARFNVGQIKELSGGGDIATRGLHEKKITKLKPSHLLLLLTNHKPHADANDAAFWARLRLITFNMRFVDDPQTPNERKKDLTLWSQLADEASGILAWLVCGCLDWQKNGLDTPQSVLNAGTAYRNEEDTLKVFLDECCIIKEDAKVKASKLYDAYKTWAQHGNLHIMNKTVFGLQLGKKKFVKTQTMHGIFYHGLGLLVSEHEESMNSLLNYSCPTEPASQASLATSEKSNHEQYEQYEQVFSKNSSREGQFLEKPVETIHTINSQENGESIKPLVEPVYDGMNSFENDQKLFMDDQKLFMDEGDLCGGCLDERIDTPAVIEHDGVMYCKKCYALVSK